jgi:hypothetical protein
MFILPHTLDPEYLNKEQMADVYISLFWKGVPHQGKNSEHFF